jgi:SAM-dependent methyltransferase
MSDDELQRILACPEDGSRLKFAGEILVCERGHRFALEQGVPIVTEHAHHERTPSNMPRCPRPLPEGPIDPFVNDWLVNTNGNLYWRARGSLCRYPIPDWPFSAGQGKTLVDVGCSWGRWSVAAAHAGYRPIGIDVHVDALTAAVRVARQLGVQARFLCCDITRLPFQPASVDTVFSYSVLQHLDRVTVMEAFREFARVLKPDGVCLFQLPNRYGLFSALHQARRGFREAAAGTFEMRYWSRQEIRAALKRAGLSDFRVRVDGFFTQNPQLSDLDLLSPAHKLIVRASYAGRQAANHFPALAWVADSLWIKARASHAKHKT